MLGQGVSFNKDLFQTANDGAVIIVGFRCKVILFTGKNTATLVQNKFWPYQLIVIKRYSFVESNESKGKQLVKQLEHLYRQSLCLSTMKVQLMITRNGDGPYDLDYNLLVMKADNEYRDPRLLKDTIRNALNKAVGGKFFSDAQDSTSCLTAILYFEKSPDIKFKFDVAITTKNKNGNYMRLIHNKNVYALGWDQYTWNEVPRSHQVKDRADEIKEEGLWQEVRDRYLEKKNMYLSWQDRNHPSFVVYVEAVNEVYNRHFNRGGGYSVQSVF